jgi:hypothetical protein
MEPTMLPGSSRVQGGTRLSVFMGPFLLAVGILSLVLTAKGIRPNPSRLPERPWVQVGLALFGLCVGGWMTADGLRAWRETERRREVLRAGPRTAWAVDHPWNPAGAQDDAFVEAAGPLGSGIAMLLLMAPYTEVAFFSPAGTFRARLIMACGNLLASVFLGRGLYLVARSLQFGRSTLEFAMFPFFLGGPLDVVFRTSVKARAFDNLRVTLQCIQERPAGVMSTKLAPFVIWKSEQMVPTPTDPVRLLFELPEDPALATRLVAPEPRYWKLEVVGERAGIDCRAEFLVPVYAPIPEAATRRPVKPQ